ncbi:MAG: hypothetical protein IT276_10210 [Ignavibacteriaceae bacterium]|nr:hypothetical protein [Ignavibacterium sp.]MCC6255280.1 hypothetical protein [Ignavibacteriaceae bacterium]HMN23360.1 hypothetical protein [Ignavibacteriaceae bacterium]HRN26042.1 hypothetical protein [Ignavibacteriaceae bacterium]HRP92616.1 hypothetical protein [Ignavibacteriaceae bacterium]
MKHLLLFSFFVLFTFVYVGCDSKSDDTVTPPVEQDKIVNTWISEGAGVAPGLAATLKTVKITATFNANNTYTVVAKDSSGADVTYSGTYTVTENTGTTIRSISLNQTAPTSVTSQGIYEVNSKGMMRYEVVQTTPAISGITAPVPAEGFGSTKYLGTPLGATWIQGFVPSAPTTELLVGGWVSEGSNVAPGLILTLKTIKIVATFNANNTYTVVATDSNNVDVTYSGTFSTTANANTTIRGITLNQTIPTSVTSTGIYRVTTKDLKYEVVQTNPAITGFTAPVAAEGFGSTKYNGIPLGATWIQTFIYQ